MSGSIFCDTNIVIRHSIAEAPQHESISAALTVLLSRENALWISRQVLREFCAVLTRPQTFPTPPDIAQVTSRARELANLFHTMDETHEVTEHLFALLESIPTGGK